MTKIIGKPVQDQYHTSVFIIKLKLGWSEYKKAKSNPYATIPAATTHGEKCM